MQMQIEIILQCQCLNHYAMSLCLFVYHY